MRFPEAAFSDAGFVEATDLRGRIFNVHVRRATMGGLALENTHPFCLGPHSFGHNGTILRYRDCSSSRASNARSATPTRRRSSTS